jgi:hypothetical protein
MKINTINNPQVRYLLSFFIFAGVLFYAYTTFFPSTSDIPIPAPEVPVSVDEPTAAANNFGNSGDALKTSPFVDITELKKNVGITPGSLPALPIVSASSFGGNASLPQIPSAMPRPNVGAVPLPAIPGASNPGTAPSPQMQDTSSVKGVITSSNGSDSIAIMGDGKVVSEGDTYRDGRVAYIGGDGIKLDDGRTIAYKQ